MNARVLALALVLLAALGGLAWQYGLVGAERSPAPRAALSRSGPERTRDYGASRPSALAREEHPGTVADEAGRLRYFRSHLESTARAWREDLGVAVHVATLHAPEEPVDRLAPEIFELRRIGADAPTGGLLILLNPAREEARIEVAYALEPALPDAVVGRITTDQLAPYAASDVAAGMAVMDALHYLKNHLYLAAIREELALDAEFRARPEFRRKARYLSGGAGAQVDLTKIPKDADWKAPVPEERRARYAPSSEPLESAETYLRTRRELVGDPSLRLYTPATRVFLSRYPFAPFEALERAAKVEASRPLRVRVQGDRAVVSSEDPAHGFIPILLHRQDGLWRVDLAETFKNLFFDGEGEYRQVNSNHPYAFGLSAFGSARPRDVAAFALDGDALGELVARLEAKDGALFDYLLAELLFRNAFAAMDALKHYERAAVRAPNAALFRHRLADRAFYLGLMDLAAEAYGELGPYAALERARAYRRMREHAAAEEAVRVALERNARNREALRLLRAILEAKDESEAAREVARRLEAVKEDPLERWRPVEIEFDPARPVLHVGEPVRIEGTRVYDHSEFSVTLRNRSRRAVEIERVRVTSTGTGHRSGLGDIKDYWSYPSGSGRLDAGESVSFHKQWGFTRDTTHVQLSYLFDLCWKGVEEGERQCRTERLDLLPP